MGAEWKICRSLAISPICPDKVDALLASSSKTLLSEGKRANVYLLEHNGQKYLLKIFHIFSLWHAIKSCFISSRAVRHFDNTQLLKRYHIKTPEVYLAREKRRFGWLIQSQMICQYIEGQDAVEYFQGVDLSTEEAKQYNQTIIEILYRFKRLGIRHGDLGVWNFRLNQDRVYVLDLDAMRRGYSKDLELFINRLCYYPAAWSRFFKTFL